MIERVAAEFGDRAGREEVRLRIAGSKVRAKVDGDRVRQAVENLVDNGLRHAGRGGPSRSGRIATATGFASS